MATEPGNIGTDLEDTESVDAFEAQIDAFLDNRCETGHRRYAVPLDVEPRSVIRTAIGNRYKDAGWSAFAWRQIGARIPGFEPSSEIALVADRECEHKCEACK